MAGLVALLTVPALYDRYGACIDACLGLAYTELLMYERVYERVCSRCYCKAKELIREIAQEDG